METKFTPGPWSQQDFSTLIVDSKKGSSQVVIANVSINTRRDEGRYNAKLIAAAPELLEALTIALDVMQSVDGANDCSRGIDAAKAAIAKATT